MAMITFFRPNTLDLATTATLSWGPGTTTPPTILPTATTLPTTITTLTSHLFTQLASLQSSGTTRKTKKKTILESTRTPEHSLILIDNF